jgi:hypothetical protein
VNAVVDPIGDCFSDGFLILPLGFLHAGETSGQNRKSTQDVRHLRYQSSPLCHTFADIAGVLSPAVINLSEFHGINP